MGQSGGLQVTSCPFSSLVGELAGLVASSQAPSIGASTIAKVSQTDVVNRIGIVPFQQCELLFPSSETSRIVCL